MNTLGSLAILVGLSVGVAGLQPHASAETVAHESAARPVPTRAEDVKPLGAGATAPSAQLLQADGKPVTLADLYAKKPTILVFYRGGWCPYCNTHLGQIATIEPELVKLGYQVLAISPDKPEMLAASVDKGGYAYQLLSDSDMTLSQAFGLAFKVDEPTVEKYRGYGIDLSKSSGKNHNLLPVPAVYVVDRKGVIRFAHHDADYTKRLSPADLVGEARRVVAE